MKHWIILTTVGLGLSAGGDVLAQEPSSPLLADAPGPPIDVGAFIGGGFFDGQLELGNSFHEDQVPGSAFLVGARAAYTLLAHMAPGTALDPDLSVELEARLAFSSTAGDPDRMRGSYSVPVLGWRAHAVLGLFADAAVQPFVLAGLGGETAFSSSPFVEPVDSDDALHWGAGVDYHMAPHYGVRADFRHALTAGRTSLTANVFELQLGFVYRFGARPAQARPQAQVVATRPEPAPTPAPVPEPASMDTDGDGLLDAVDQCPDEAETINHIEDDDGCPEADEDGDELPDVVDQCPAEAEDDDGFEDLDGCPDRDNDGDGRPDVIDACLQEPETINGFEDDDGCPDQVPQALHDGLASIRFLPNSMRLEGAKKQLDALVALLAEHPSVNLQLSGHTDDRERKADKLSLDRANAVKTYLVGQGVETERLETQGHGATRPEANNRTKLGKARNRRVDFDLVPGPATIPDPTLPEPQPQPATPPASQPAPAPQPAAPPATQ